MLEKKKDGSQERPAGIQREAGGEDLTKRGVAQAKTLTTCTLKANLRGVVNSPQ